MGTSNRYVLGMVAAAALTSFAGFYFFRGTVRTLKNAEFDMSYTMPRPKSVLYNFLFGLEGRTIDRKEINEVAKNKAPAANTAGAGGVRADKPKIQDPKASSTKTAGAVKPAIPAPTKKPQVTVNVVNNAPQDNGVGSGSSPEGSDMTPNGGVGTAPYRNTNTTNTDTAKSDTISGAQWRSLVVGQPTKENVNKLITAFNNKEVDAGTLYLIMSDLLQSSNSETQSMGLLIGQSVPSLKSFSVVSESYDKLDAGVKKSADTYLATYAQSSRLSILTMALQSENNQVVYHAAQALVTGLEQIKSGGGGTGTRADAGRGVAASGAGSKYTSLVTVLQSLLASGDSSVAGLAQNALSQIQSLSNT